jgi:CBS domain-containing protein
MKTVKEILADRFYNHIYSLVPNQSVLSAAQFMKFKNLGAVPVMKDNLLVGIVSERDMLNKVVGLGLDPRDVPVESIMSKALTVTSPQETIADCLLKMKNSHCRHLPVVENSNLIGMISLRDVLGEMQEFASD